MADSQKKREDLIRRHMEKMNKTTVEERKKSEKKILDYFSRFRDVDISEQKREEILS